MTLSKQFTRREKVLLAILGLLLVGAAYYFAVQQPVQSALDTLTYQQEDVSSEILALQAKEQRLSEMRAELEEILSQPNAAQTPHYDNLQALMVFLNALLGSTSDYSLNFRPVELPEDGTVVRRVIDMSFTCAGYEQARSAVESLRDCVYRCQLGDLRMAPVTAGQEQGGDVAASGALQVNLTVTFFESVE